MAKMVKRDSQAPIYVDEYGHRVGGGRDWAGIAKMFSLAILAGIILVVFVHLYWGPDGVKMFGYIMLGLFLVVATWAMIMANMSMFSAHTRSVVRSTTEALINVQVADDKGEVGRISAAIQGAHHDSAMMARRMMTTAKEMADEQKANTASNVPSINDLLLSQFGSSDNYGSDDEDDDIV